MTDPCLLAATCDATVLVVDQSKTTLPAVVHAKKALDRVGARVIGIVLNKLDPKGGQYYNIDNYYQEMAPTANHGHANGRQGRRRAERGGKATQQSTDHPSDSSGR